MFWFGSRFPSASAVFVFTPRRRARRAALCNTEEGQSAADGAFIIDTSSLTNRSPQSEPTASGVAASHHAFAGSPPAIMPSRVPTLALAPLHQHSHACHARAGTKWRPFCPVTPTAQHYRDEPPSLLTFAWISSGRPLTTTPPAPPTRCSTTRPRPTARSATTSPRTRRRLRSPSPTG